MAGIPIKKLQLSVRANHALHKMGIETIDQLIITPLEMIAVERNVGTKTLEEISNILTKINQAEIVIDDLIEIEEQFVTDKKRLFSDAQLVELSHHSIKELDIPIRAVNVLKRMQCTTLNKVVLLSKDDLQGLNGLGEKSIEEMLKIIDSWLYDNLFFPSNENEHVENNIDPNVVEYYRRLETMLLPIGYIHWQHLLQYSNVAGLTDRILYGGFSEFSNENLVALLELPELQSKLKMFFLELAPSGIIRMCELRENLNKKKLNINLELVFNRLTDGTICIVKENYCYIIRDSFMCYIENNCSDKTDRKNCILERRINGEKLQIIADEFGLTRERVRQILLRMVRKFPLLHEDFYKEPYEYFKFSKQEFCEAFPMCGEKGYEYLFIRYHKGTALLVEDVVQQYKGIFSERIKKYINEVAVRQDKRTISKMDMVYRMLISHSEKSLSMDEFEEIYYEYVDKKGFSRERLTLNMHTMANHLRNSKGIVFDKNNCVRYCDADVKRIWETIDFRKYENLVISAELIFREYKDFMDEIDIRDGYELFYVIKSSLEYWPFEGAEIICRRVPVIVFGDGDEALQAIQLLKEIYPIEYFDYYAAYEERFGLRKESAQGNPNINGGLSRYYVDGRYSIDIPAISDKDEEKFKCVLASKSIWFINDLREVFRQVCINSSIDALNAAAFKRIGYSLNAGYAYSNCYKTVANYFDTEVFSNDIVDINTLDQRLVNLPVFLSALDRKKKDLEYIEIAPKILMSRERVEAQYGINEEDIKILQEKILTSCNDKYFNAHSIWAELGKDPMICKLQDNEWMCTCIFRQQEGVFSLSVAGGIILSKDSNILSLSKVCEWIVEMEGKMSIQRLVRLFNEKFGTSVHYSKLASRLKSSGMWNCISTDSLEDYIDSLVDTLEMNDKDFFREEFF